MFGGTREVEAQLQREAAAEAATERHRARGAAPGRGLLIQQPSSLLRREHRAAPRRRTGGQKLTGRVSLLGSAGPKQPAPKPHRRPEKSRARSEARQTSAIAAMGCGSHRPALCCQLPARTRSCRHLRSTASCRDSGDCRREGGTERSSWISENSRKKWGPECLQKVGGAEGDTGMGEQGQKGPRGGAEGGVQR